MEAQRQLRRVEGVGTDLGAHELDGLALHAAHERGVALAGGSHYLCRFGDVATVNATYVSDAATLSVRARENATGSNASMLEMKTTAESAMNKLKKMEKWKPRKEEEAEIGLW